MDINQEKIEYIFFVVPENKIQLTYDTDTSFESLCYRAASILDIDPEGEMYLLNYYPIDENGKKILPKIEPQEELPF